MAKTIIGLFDQAAEAQLVVKDLMDHGFTRDEISVIANNEKGQYASTNTTHTTATGGHSDHIATGAGTGATAGTVIGGALGLLARLGVMSIPGFGAVVLAGPLVATLTGAGIGAAAGGIVGALVGWGVPEDDANSYAEGIRRGGTLVAVKADEADVEEVSDVFNRHHAVDIEKRSAEWRSAGWTPEPVGTANADRTTPSSVSAAGGNALSNAGAAAGNAARNVKNAVAGAMTGERPASGTSTSANRAADEEQRLPVVEEELAIGKRLVQRGGVRIYHHVTERPVSENVTLREERVVVERRPANRAIDAKDLENFRDGTVEVTESVEEAVVSKRAKVVEEVVVRKNATERQQEVRDTVRRMDVDVEKIDSANPNATRSSNTSAEPLREGRV